MEHALDCDALRYIVPNRYRSYVNGIRHKIAINMCECMSATREWSWTFWDFRCAPLLLFIANNCYFQSIFFLFCFCRRSVAAWAWWGWWCGHNEMTCAYSPMIKRATEKTHSFDDDPAVSCRTLPFAHENHIHIPIAKIVAFKCSHCNFHIDLDTMYSAQPLPPLLTAMRFTCAHHPAAQNSSRARHMQKSNSEPSRREIPIFMFDFGETQNNKSRTRILSLLPPSMMFHHHQQFDGWKNINVFGPQKLLNSKWKHSNSSNSSTNKTNIPTDKL